MTNNHIDYLFQEPYIYRERVLNYTVKASNAGALRKICDLPKIYRWVGSGDGV